MELEPDFAEAHYHLGSALKDQGKLDEAADCCRRALELKPDYAEAHVGLGNALMAQGKLDEAVARYRRALELKPGFAETYNNLGNALKDQGMLDEAVACYRRALELQPDRAEVHSNLLLTLQYCAAATPQSLAEAHAEYDRTHAAHLRAAPGMRTSASVMAGPAWASYRAIWGGTPSAISWSASWRTSARDNTRRSVTPTRSSPTT